MSEYMQMGLLPDEDGSPLFSIGEAAMQETVIVRNSSDNSRVEYNSITPREAVRNAFAQYTRRDWNAWDYAKYDDLVIEGELFLHCGNWHVLK
jgi:hypothetical protein